MPRWRHCLRKCMIAPVPRPQMRSRRRCSIRSFFQLLGSFGPPQKIFSSIVISSGACGQIKTAEFGDWKDAVLIWPQAPLDMTIEEKMFWGGPNDPNNWKKDLMEQRRRDRICGRGTGAIMHFSSSVSSADGKTSHGCRPIDHRRRESGWRGHRRRNESFGK